MSLVSEGSAVRRVLLCPPWAAAPFLRALLAGVARAALPAWLRMRRCPRCAARASLWFAGLPLAVDAEAGLDSCWVGSSQ